MADVFISYARDDRLRVEPLARAIGEQGWSVWWDRIIPPGRTFDAVIEQELASARCVIVIWSRASVASEWVKTEAAEAARRGILVPVLLEHVQIPLEFRRVQAANLADWRGESSHSEFVNLVQAIAIHAPRPSVGATVASVGVPQQSPPRAEPVPSRTEPAIAASNEHKKRKKVRWAIGIASPAAAIGFGLSVWLWITTEIKPPNLVGEPPQEAIFNPKEKAFELRDSAKFSPKRELTLEAWFKADAVNTRQAIITKLHPAWQSGEPYYQYNLELRPGGKLYFALSINDIRQSIDEAFSVERQEWHYVSATYDGKWIRLYLDGEEYEDPLRKEGELRDYGEPVRVGGVNSDRPFMGQLAEVRIWEVARTRDQIIAAFNRIIPTDEEGLVWSSSAQIK